MADDDVADILDPAFLDGLADLSLAEVRARRDRATQIETGLSYLRRLVQGRLDIVVAERSRRAAGLPPGDLAGLVDRLPEILGDHVHAPGFGRLPTILAPGEVDAALEARIESIVPTATLSGLSELADSDLDQAFEALEGLEREVSAQRRSLHGVLDALQEEIVRRYRSGEASVDSLLQ